MKRNQLTLEQHKQLGDDLKRVKMVLDSAWLLLRDTYGPHSKKTKIMLGAINAFCLARIALDEEIPQGSIYDVAPSHVYYGPPLEGYRYNPPSAP